MTIQPLANNANKISLSSKSTTNETEKNTDAKISKNHKKDIDFTAVAQEITKAFKSSNNTSPIDEKRVQEVRHALANGTLKIDAESIAKEMIAREQAQFDDSR